MNIKKIEPVTNSYGKSMDNPGKRDMSFDTTPKKSRDVLEISSEGQDAVNRSVGQKGYELSKVMNIHQKRANGEASEEEIKYYWRTRENDPALDMDRLIYAVPETVKPCWPEIRLARMVPTTVSKTPPK